MFSFMGGYHRRLLNPGDSPPVSDGIDTTSIYFCPAARTLNGEAFAYAMTHELAHYVGPMENGIDDNAYFHKTPDKYRNLTPTAAFHNADSYAQFAFDAVGKPDFDVAANAS